MESRTSPYGAFSSRLDGNGKLQLSRLLNGGTPARTD